MESWAVAFPPSAALRYHGAARSRVLLPQDSPLVEGRDAKFGVVLLGAGFRGEGFIELERPRRVLFDSRPALVGEGEPVSAVVVPLLGALPVPLDRFRVVALEGSIEVSQHAHRGGVALFRRPKHPALGLVDVALDAEPMEVGQCELALRGRVTLRGGEREPLKSLLAALVDALAVPVEPSHVVLGHRVFLTRGQLVPLSSLLVVSGAAASVVVEMAEVKLSLGVAARGIERPRPLGQAGHGSFTPASHRRHIAGLDWARHSRGAGAVVGERPRASGSSPR